MRRKKRFPLHLLIIFLFFAIALVLGSEKRIFLEFQHNQKTNGSIRSITFGRQSHINRPISSENKSSPILKFSPNIKDTISEEGKCKIAIIIDDVGYDPSLLRSFWEIDVPLTFSILPNLEHSSSLAKEISARGHSILLHLPMEPENNTQYSEIGSITMKMSDQEIIESIEKDLQTTPGVEGISNHMGSKATGDERVMMIVLRLTKRKRLFFIDSLTTNHSVITKIAHQLRVPTASRQVFLDNSQDLDHIMRKLEELAEYAIRNGEAIGIGHVHPQTAEAIREVLPEWKKRRIIMVPASELTR